MAPAGANDHHEQEPPRDMPPVKARQGLLGRRVLVVLLAALALTMTVWLGVEIFGETIAPPQEEQVGDPATVEPGG